MPEVIKHRSYGLSDIGLVRQVNEDHYLINNSIHLFAVADGLGGLPKGDLASRVAIEELDAMVNTSEGTRALDFAKIFYQIAEVVIQVGQEINNEMGIATTLTAMKIEGDRLLVGHVGDSGLFLYRKGHHYLKLTKDHTMAQEMRDHKDFDENTYIPEYFHHTLTRCIGNIPELVIDTHEYQILPGDRFLLYSDGVTKTIAGDELEELAFQIDSPKLFVETIINLSNDRGGPDNTTAVAVFID